MNTGEPKGRKPLKSGVFRLPSPGEDGGYLIGRKCKGCESYFFPNSTNPNQKLVCPLCYSQEMEEAPLSRRGQVWSYTVAHQVYPGTPLPPPLLSAVVELPEQVLVMTAIVDCDPAEIKIGMEVELDFMKVAEDKENNEIIAFVFKPVRR